MNAQHKYYNLDTNHVQDKLDHAQRHAYMLNQNMMHLAHKISKIRDIGDELVRILLSFAEKDTFDYQLTKSLKQLTSCLSSVEDHRDYEIDRLSSSVIKELGHFSELLKFTKTEVKAILTARDKELSKQKKYSGIIGKVGQNIQTIKIAEANTELSKIKVKDLQVKLVDQLERFEMEKQKSMREIFRKFLLIQMSYSSQAIQIYKLAYKCLVDDMSDYATKNALREMSKGLYSRLELESSFNYLMNETTRVDVASSSHPSTPAVSSKARRRSSSQTITRQDSNRSLDAFSTLRASTHSPFPTSGLIRETAHLSQEEDSICEAEDVNKSEPPSQVGNTSAKCIKKLFGLKDKKAIGDPGVLRSRQINKVSLAESDDATSDDEDQRLPRQPKRPPNPSASRKQYFNETEL